MRRLPPPVARRRNPAYCAACDQPLLTEDWLYGGYDPSRTITGECPTGCSYSDQVGAYEDGLQREADAFGISVEELLSDMRERHAQEQARRKTKRRRKNPASSIREDAYYREIADLLRTMPSDWRRQYRSGKDKLSAVGGPVLPAGTSAASAPTPISCCSAASLTSSGVAAISVSRSAMRSCKPRAARICATCRICFAAAVTAAAVCDLRLAALAPALGPPPLLPLATAAEDGPAEPGVTSFGSVGKRRAFLAGEGDGSLAGSVRGCVDMSIVRIFFRAFCFGSLGAPPARTGKSAVYKH